MDSPERVSAALAATTRFADVRHHREIASTNDAVADAARRGVGEGLVVVADRQTAGRGRLGRAWDAPPGTALLASVLLRPADLGPDRLHLLTATVGLAAADACRDLAGVAVEVKWPNDLLVGPAKLAGILAELAVPASGRRPPAVAVGLGLNVTASPPGATDLAAHSATVPSVAALLAAVLAGIEARCGHWEEVAVEYRRRCATVGRRVRVEPTAGPALTGTARDVDAHGRLVVDVDGAGRTALSAGDVHHLRPADGAGW